MGANGPLVVVGESFLDRDVDGYVGRVAADAPVPVLEEVRSVARPGAAAHTALWVARDAGASEVVLVTALGRDEAGDRVKQLLEMERVTVVDLGWTGPTTEKVRLRGNGQSLLRLDRGTGFGEVLTPDRAVDLIEAARSVLVSDYGRGLVGLAPIRSSLTAAALRTTVVWDPHVRGGLPVPGTTVVTPNLAELAGIGSAEFAPDIASIGGAAARVLRQRGLAAVAVTMSERGVLLVTPDETQPVPAPQVVAVDPCGAGDRFAAALAVRLTLGSPLYESVNAAVALAARFVASDPALRAAPSLGSTVDEEDAVATLVREARKQGLRVVATSGCFDLIHPGHARFLDEARRRGDMLVVLLNSDGSVRRLKGAGRPVNTERDRALVLRSLGAVDAVVVFAEDTPADALRRIRPSLFVKGGDYSVDALPEYTALREIGAEVEILRYWPGYSTTSLIASLLP